MGRIRFANQLRGIAALCVGCSHLIGVYWAMPAVVSAATATPPPHAALPDLFWWVARPWFNLGPFGVGLFFLISGLVVPFSLDQHGGKSFILARLLRIYPTYAASLLLGLTAVYVSSRFWGLPLPYTPAMVAGNVTLVYDLVGQPSLDLVNWTLSVELKFYLVIMFMAKFIRRGSAAAILLVAFGLCLSNLLLTHGFPATNGYPPSSPGYTFSSQSLCLLYMLMGVLFNFHILGKIGVGRLVVSLAIVALLFVVTWLCSVWQSQYPIVTVNYGYALGLFATLYALRNKVPRNPLLDGMAAISFPFYVLHSLFGFSLLRTMMVGAGISYYPAVLMTLISVLLVCWAMHTFVERPTQRLGRLLGRRTITTPRAACATAPAACD